MCFQVQGHNLTLALVHLPREFKDGFFRNQWAVMNQIFMETFCYKKMKIYEYDAGHMTKMAPTPIYAKNASIILFSGTRGLISMKIVM